MKKENKSNEFKLLVNAISFPYSTKVYLYNRDIDTNIDSTYVINENFEFNGEIDTPSLTYLNFSDKKGTPIDPYTYFYLDADVINIKGQFSDFLNAEVLGSFK